ncbi:MAG: UV DNA damage repair endonuclease UvsE [Candidatus Caldatribacteriaceae bacterium]
MFLRYGLFCSTRDGKLSTNRTFRLSNLCFEKVYSTVKRNLEDFKAILVLCQKNHLTMFRLGNSLVPFASHPNFRESWWDGLIPLFERARDFYRDFDIRLTMHPGQFIQLGSPKEEVVLASLRELKYCTRVLDLLEAKEGVVTLHIGGKNSSEGETLERFRDNFAQNMWLKKYLALENDEKNFNALATLSLCEACGIPMVFDIFHHSLNQSDISWSRIKKTWGNRRAKVHISSQGEGKIGTHAMEIKKSDWKTLLEFLGEDYQKVDIMVEAKGKEEAIKKLQSYDCF